MTWAARFVAPSAPKWLHAHTHVCKGGMCLCTVNPAPAELVAELEKEEGATCESRLPRAEPPSAPRQFEEMSEGRVKCKGRGRALNCQGWRELLHSA